MLLAPLAGIPALLAVHVPELVAVVAEVVLVVFLQLLEACLGHVHQLDACLYRCRSSLVSFTDVLLAATCRLFHLVDGSIAYLRQVVFNKIERDIVDTFRLPKGD